MDTPSQALSADNLRTLYLLFGGFGFALSRCILLLEALDAARCVDQLLFAGEERMATGADFDAQHVSLDGRARFKRIAAGAVHCDGVIVGMNTGFHEAPHSRPVCALPVPGTGLTSASL